MTALKWNSIFPGHADLTIEAAAVSSDADNGASGCGVDILISFKKNPNVGNYKIK